MNRGRLPRLSFARDRFRRSALPILLLAASLPGLAAGQQPSDKVYELLESASHFHLLGDIHTLNLETGQTMQVAATLLEGADYMIAGFCDDGCTDLNLSLVDPTGDPVTEDHLPDAEPLLWFTAEATGSFVIRVDAVTCSEDGCEIALGILGSSDEPDVPPGEDMESTLALVAAEYRTQGFTPSGQQRRGALAGGAATKVPIDLVEGVAYRIVGVCDHDCPDLDLALFDPDGEEVAGDFMEDDLPILSHRADTTAEHSVEVIMVACSVNPCSFRIETFSQVDPSLPGAKTFSGELISHETHQGELTEDDAQTDNAFVDSFEVEAEAGQRIVVDLRSTEFDTLVRLIPPEGKPTENDDFGVDTGHSHIEFLAPISGTYSVQVTSYTITTTGPYTLQIAVVR